MDKASPTWRPVIPHELRHEAGMAGAEHDLGAGRYMLLCLRHNLDRLGRLPEAFALDEIEHSITAGWDLAHSSLELETSGTEPLPPPQFHKPFVVAGVSDLLPRPELTCPFCGVVEPDARALLDHVCASRPGADHE